ncbi:MAG: hypothetical protein ACI8RD_004432, partial [Bacillariaceae sp.]
AVVSTELKARNKSGTSSPRLNIGSSTKHVEFNTNDI